MAKLSSIMKNDKRKQKAFKLMAHRKMLRKKAGNLKISEEERQEAGIALQKLPSNSSLSRVVRRCSITGRPRGNLRRFGLSRLVFRKLAHQGKIPGVIKSSW